MADLAHQPHDDGNWMPDMDRAAIEPGYVPTAPKVDGFVIELEQQLLGAILGGGDHGRVFSILKPHNFVEPIHGQVFELIAAARESYGGTSLPIVVKLIPKDLADTFKAAAGVTLAGYLSECTSHDIYGAGTSHQIARGVLEQWARVSVGREAALVADAARDPHSKPAELVRTAAAALDDVMADLRSAGRGRTLSSFAKASSAALIAAREAKQKGGLAGVGTGLADLDRATGGLHRSDLIVLAARPSMGKTVVGTAFARRAAAHGVGAGFISLEMDAGKLAARLISDIGHDRGIRVPYQDLINGTAELDMIDALESSQRDYEALPLWIEDQSGLTVTDIKTKTEKLIEAGEKAGVPLGLLVVDHMHLIKASSRYAGNRVQEVTEISGGLKGIARDYNLAVVLLAQLSRAVETRDDKRPQLSDLRDSGSIEQDADTVMFLYRRGYYLERNRPKDADAIIKWKEDCAAAAHDLELSIAKQRNGPTRTIDLYVDVACSAVRNKARGYGDVL